ncbi:hypothetical protein DFJ67_0877 [Asanoa ferruginea]|uniref:Uncharacterized protein n=1 Tax=Asanoa ferruginea TaxID=53367 RepID=A0A3D9ZEP4_9ACTN|nr:hypothetical protein [Asanoa ferruginea]REF94932.1 hypothetical protein DFJ67_0877 [Asanoa ferruginea]
MKPRYSLRPGAVALTRAQWVAVGLALAVALVGGVTLALVAGLAAAGILVGVAGLVVAMVAAFGRRSGA